MPKFIIGIDGGGSKCKAVLYPCEMHLAGISNSDVPVIQSVQGLDSVTTGSANVFTDFDASISEIMKAATVLCERNGLSFSQCILSAACAGGGVESSQTIFASWQHPFAQAHLLNDVQGSCIAANDNKDCALLIVGTGSCLAVHQQGSTKTFGGHGFLLGDFASGADLGRSAMQAYLQHLDNTKHNDPLFTAMASGIADYLQLKFADEPKTRHAFASEAPAHQARLLIKYFAKAAASEFAHFAKVVLAQSTESALAGEIIGEAPEYLAALIENNTNDNQALFIDGGLATYYKPLLEARLKRTVEIPTAPAEYGAFLYAMNFL